MSSFYKCIYMCVCNYKLSFFNVIKTVKIKQALWPTYKSKKRGWTRLLDWHIPVVYLQELEARSHPRSSLPPSLSNGNNCVRSATVYSFISLFGHASSTFLTLPNETTAVHAHAARKPCADAPVTIYTSKYAHTHSHTLMAKCKDFS